MTGDISVRRVQSILGELGHEISIGHCHELLSRLQGFKSHNHNKQKISSLPKAGEYSVKIKANVENGYENTEIEIKKYLNIAASSRLEAEDIVEKMLEDEDFLDSVREYDDWEVIYNTADIKVEKTGRTEKIPYVVGDKEFSTFEEVEQYAWNELKIDLNPMGGLDPAGDWDEQKKREACKELEQLLQAHS